jgi:inorganic pyrophosphatase
MSPYQSLPPFDPGSGLINAVVDTPRGSHGKYKLDETTGLFRLGKNLPLGAVFPYNFGFIPGTRGEDGDAVDVLMLMDEPIALGAVVPLRLIGVLKAEQTETSGKVTRNDRLLGVLETPYNPAELSDISGLHPHRIDEIEHFFKSYNAMEGRSFRPLGRDGAEAAQAAVRASLI